MSSTPIRLAVVISHPIQYFAPWFQELAQDPHLDLKVFYLWDFGIKLKHDYGFSQPLKWDLPLLDGYNNCFVPNRAKNPGTHHFNGLSNPDLVQAVLAWRPDALLLFGYAYCSHLRLLLDPRLWRLPVLFRGDSHLLCPRLGLKAKVIALLRRMLFCRFAAGLPVGKANAEWMAQCGIPRSRQFLAPHAVDNARFQAAAAAAEESARIWRNRLGIAASAPVVLFAGKLEAIKRPLDLMKAFVALQHPDAVLVFVGAGPLEGVLRQQASTLSKGRVILQGFQNQSAMPSVYALADLVVLPSESETWGLCINEAMNLAKPVIVSNNVGCWPDLVIQGRTGWIFPSGDRAALTAALAEALSDPARLKRMGRDALHLIQNYSFNMATVGLLRALDAVVRRSS